MRIECYVLSLLALSACNAAQTPAPAAPSSTAADEARTVVAAKPASPTTSASPARVPPEAAGTIESRVERTASGELVSVQVVIVDGPVARVWDAYTTSIGWQAWVAPLAEVDLRVGGLIRTNYDAKGTLGDANTNTLRIVNYVPERVLTLQADVSKNWPEFMKSEAGNLYNVILFTPLGDHRTRITSYGTGMKDDERFRQLIGYFAKANAMLYRRLQEYVASSGSATPPTGVP